MPPHVRRFALLAALLALPCQMPADEGMWLFSAPPREKLKAAYGFTLTDAWLDHVMKASVKFGGGSGSFVSADGLVLTNHHVGRSTLQKLSTPEKNYARDGFYARTRAEELKCPDLELNVLQSTEDVTARIKAAVPPGATPETAALERRKITAAIEQESLERTKLHSTVVTLYQGGQYHLYRYKRYTDVRLVFAPDAQIAFFGGDPDNFEYPRYDLDVCFFRVYEDGAPARPEHFLAWSARGAQDGELVFVTGHPGNTDRLLTATELEFRRDVQMPQALHDLYATEVLLTVWSGRSDENARRAARVLLSAQNNRKRSDGLLAALQDPSVIAGKRAAEEDFKRELARHNETAALAAYEKIAAAQQRMARDYRRYRLLEGAGGFAGQSFTFARELLRVADERLKPNGERLRAFTDARRPTMELALFSKAPIYEDLEILRLGASLTALVAELGSDDALVRAVLAGKSPRDRAAELIQGTHVSDVAFRRKLYEGGVEAVKAARDPLIELARLIDPESRALFKKMEMETESVRQAQAEIARARFAIVGASQYPDATGTLRLSYGAVKAYEEGGHPVPAHTVTAGLFERSQLHQGREPFDLAPRWLERKAALDPATPFNFVSTCDIIGGNSGSPTINHVAEFVGIIFDGNIQSLSGAIAYDDRQSRAVSVHSAAIIEALRKVYDAGALADELLLIPRRSAASQE